MKVLPVIALVILSLTTLACAQPVLPTATPYPTYTPAPTYTPYPTLAALPTHTPYPTYTPYPTLTDLPTHTPYPTYTPYPTETPLPTPTTTPSHRVYQSNKDRFEVTIPIDWNVDTRTEVEGTYRFNFPDAEGAAFIIPLEIDEAVPLPLLARQFLKEYQDNLLFELLEDKRIDSNRWRIHFRLFLTDNDCFLSEIESVLNRVGGIVYVTNTGACPSYLERRGADVDQFHESFRAW